MAKVYERNKGMKMIVGAISAVLLGIGSLQVHAQYDSVPEPTTKTSKSFLSRLRAAFLPGFARPSSARRGNALAPHAQYDDESHVLYSNRGSRSFSEDRPPLSEVEPANNLLHFRF